MFRVAVRGCGRWWVFTFRQPSDETCRTTAALNHGQHRHMAISERTRRARALRRQMTEAERRLWHALRDTPLPWKLRRQHPVGPHIADFAVPARKLVIEIDGGQHALNRDADAARSAVLAEYGYRVVRFWNDQVMDELDEVMAQIWRELELENAGEDDRG